MSLSLNKFEDLGTLTKPQVDQNWKDIEEFSDGSAEDVLGMLAENAVTPKAVGDALDWITIPYAASLTLDGSQFAQGVVVLAGNSELVQPVNFAKGTKYLLVQGDDATTRTLSFDDSVFKGDRPTLEDISATRWYLLCLVAIAADHIVVMSHRAL